MRTDFGWEPGRDEWRLTRRDAIAEQVRFLALATGARPRSAAFGRMFPELSAAADRLPEQEGTLTALLRLAASMVAPAGPVPEPRLCGPGDGSAPAAYTYLLSFVLNDLAMERPGVPTGAGADFAPEPSLEGLFNRRRGRLELESVHDAPRDPAWVARMLVGAVAESGHGLPRPPRKANGNDLPRFSRHAEPARDRVPRCGDGRNDELLILSQLHVAFLKAHNGLVAAGADFAAARRALRQRYQWMVLFDLAPLICNRAVLNEVMERGPRLLPAAPAFALPVEFCAAAFALAPTMMRASYDYNPNFRNIERGALATRFALGTAGRGPHSLPEHWIIGWEGFLPLEGRAPQRARAFNTELAGAPQTVSAQAAHHLLNGYRLGLPTGQAVAAALGLTPLSGGRLLEALPERQRAAASPFAEATPLWFYVLAEAGAQDGPAGAHLGPVGSRIVAETLWQAARLADDSILAPDAVLDFERFTLTDLILLAQEQDAVPN